MPEITEVFYPHNRQQWRDWLQTYHQSGKTEVWLQTYRKATGKPSLPYDDMVEECLCFGWIDGVNKKYDEESAVQRITPRKKKTFLSELNRQRVWKLQQQGLMTPAGVAPIADQIGQMDDPLVIPEWIVVQLQQDPEVWENFSKFPHFYKRLKIGWINEITGNSREAEKQKRLNYLIKMSKQGKMYGTQPLKDF
ncbi:MAG: YdeI/OmpD-associated family protein [Haliscomenobacter sp.]|uniref:YdeI/OmpD-associated family protein n=1 Tax=Haliscomenobacter sp. TaxID=2717303 RepID=UPI0029B72CAC|nr:YdeI/OmpD-associated family protein [Haliscomenobacter sp.]MDX2070572.1 YdeI/OmpD-associated family protein [Haliscomenobacter sp.]